MSLSIVLEKVGNRHALLDVLPEIPGSWIAKMKIGPCHPKSLETHVERSLASED